MDEWSERLNESPRRGFPEGTLIPVVGSPTEPIEAVMPGDQVIGGDGYPLEVKDCCSIGFEGELIEINPACFPAFRVTPEHPLVVWRAGKRERRRVAGRKFDRRQAGESISLEYSHLRRKGPLKRKAKAGTQVVQARFLSLWDYLFFPKYQPKEESPWKDFSIGECWSLGLLVAEGSCQEPWQVGLCQSCRNTPIFERYKTWAEAAFPGKIWMYHRKSDDCMYLRINDRAFTEFFSKNFGESAYEKRIPIQVLDLPRGKLEAFLQGYWAGDGCVKGNRGRASTRSFSLALDLQLALSRLGYLGSLTCQQESGRSHFRLGLSGAQFLGMAKADSQHSPAWSVDKDWYCIPAREIKRVSYRGRIFHLELDGDKTFLAPVLMHS